MKLKPIGTSLIAASLALAYAPAHAVETGIDWLHISGFGTLAATHTNLNKSDNIEYAPNIKMANGTSNKWTGGTDSRLGVQATADINSALSATLQVVSRQNATGSYTPEATLANIKYEFTPDVSVRVGRVGLPVFLISDYMTVGYSQPWMRPPIDVYHAVPPAPVDGADALFRFHAGDTTISFQPVIGKGSFETPIFPGGVSEMKISNIRSFAVSAEYGSWTARYGNERSTTKNDALPGVEIKDNFNNLGLIYDKDAWLVQAEYTWRTTNDILGLGKLDHKAAYVTTGYRIGTVMPHITFSRYLDQSANGTPGSTENTVALGIRWDFYKNMALKAQWDHITRPSGRFETLASPGYSGLFRTNATPITDNKAVNVIAVGLDFVF